MPRRRERSRSRDADSGDFRDSRPRKDSGEVARRRSSKSSRRSPSCNPNTAMSTCTTLTERMANHRIDGEPQNRVVKLDEEAVAHPTVEGAEDGANPRDVDMNANTRSGSEDNQNEDSGSNRNWWEMPAPRRGGRGGRGSGVGWQSARPTMRMENTVPGIRFGMQPQQLMGSYPGGHMDRQMMMMRPMLPSGSFIDEVTDPETVAAGGNAGTEFNPMMDARVAAAWQTRPPGIPFGPGAFRGRGGMWPGAAMAAPWRFGGVGGGGRFVVREDMEPRQDVDAVSGVATTEHFTTPGGGGSQPIGRDIRAAGGFPGVPRMMVHPLAGGPGWLGGAMRYPDGATVERPPLPPRGRGGQMWRGQMMMMMGRRREAASYLEGGAEFENIVMQQMAPGGMMNKEYAEEEDVSELQAFLDLEATRELRIHSFLGNVLDNLEPDYLSQNTYSFLESSIPQDVPRLPQRLEEPSRITVKDSGLSGTLSLRRSILSPSRHDNRLDISGPKRVRVTGAVPNNQDSDSIILQKSNTVNDDTAASSSSSLSSGLLPRSIRDLPLNVICPGNGPTDAAVGTAVNEQTKIVRLNQFVASVRSYRSLEAASLTRPTWFLASITGLLPINAYPPSTSIKPLPAYPVLSVSLLPTNIPPILSDVDFFFVGPQPPSSLSTVFSCWLKPDSSNCSHRDLVSFNTTTAANKIGGRQTTNRRIESDLIDIVNR